MRDVGTLALKKPNIYVAQHAVLNEQQLVTLWVVAA
jgi:pyruvate/2-oxoacid:ferredoxin oxidoreductase beta subunit